MNLKRDVPENDEIKRKTGAKESGGRQSDDKDQGGPLNDAESPVPSVRVN